MTRPAPAAVAECLRQIETGSFSSTNLTNAGFSEGASLVGKSFGIEVSGPVQQGWVQAPLRLGVNIGPSSGTNLRPGCKLTLPAKGSAAASFGVLASQAAQASGFSVDSRGRGSFIFQKGTLRILMNTKRITGNGVNAVETRIREVQS